MLNKIIYFSLNNRMATLACSILLFFAGIYTAGNMEVDVFPDLNAPTVVVMTEAQGMAPEEVERLVTFPVETALNGATNVRRVRSSSTTGFSVVWVEFDWGTDIYKARQIVSEKLSIVGESLPDNVGQPTLGPQSSILGEVLIVGLTSDTTSLQELRTIADWVVRPRLLATGGVAQVTVLGGEIKEYQILLDPARMKHYGVTLDEVLAATEQMNRNASGGILYEYGNEYIVRGVLATADTVALGKALVKSVNDMPVLLENVANIRTGNKSPKLGMASERTKPAVLLTVTKQPASGTIELTDRLDATLEDIRKMLPDDVHVSSDTFRQSRFIESSIDNVKSALLEGGIFVVIVLFLFLMNVRTTVISLAAIPLSLLVAVLTLKIFGMTINTMSLGGMAIAIGSLVDDAIVDVENVFKRLRMNRQLPDGERKSTLQVVYDASCEVRMPIFNSTLIIIASFVPLFFLSGMEGRMLAPLGITFIVSLCASTFVALTLTPVLSSYLLGGKPKSAKADREPFLTRKLKAGYHRALDWTLAHKKLILSSTFTLLIVAVTIFFTLGRGFLPPFNEGSFTVGIRTLPGIDLEESDKLARRAEELILSVDEIQTVARKTGRAELDEHSFGANVSEIEAPFELNGRSKDQVIAELREKLLTLPGVNIEIGQPISHRIDAMLSGSRANIAIKIFGPDMNRLYGLGNRIKTAVQDIEGIADLNVEQQIERPQLKIVPRREMLARYGVTLPEFSRLIQVMLGGEVVSQVYESGRSFDLTVKVTDDNRDRIRKIHELIIDAGGSKIPLGQVASIESASGPNTVERENVQRKIVVSANVTGGDLRGVVNAIRDAVDKQVDFPEDYHVEYGGQFESAEAASRILLIASVFAILVIFLLLYNEFRNSVQALVILLNLPLALIGGILMIRVTSGVVSIPAIIGFISLFGIATRNGMLLVSRYNDLCAQGVPLHKAIVSGSLDRLNPILMTALTSALALIPLAVSGGLSGSEIQSPMAQVILGGLVTSTFLNMFVIPIMYGYIGKRAGKEENLITGDSEH
jgi:Cu(I)/Ag(I) efflux system membrane protein CusA/SilA